MGFSKLLSLRSLPNAVGSRVWMRLLATDSGHPPPSDKPPKPVSPVGVRLLATEASHPPSEKLKPAAPVGARQLASEAGQPGQSPQCCDKPPKVQKSDVQSTQAASSKNSAIVGVFQDDQGKLQLTEAGKALDQESGGKISQRLNEVASELKVGKAFVVTDVGSYSAVALASYGPEEAGFNELESLDEGRENTRWGVGAGMTALRCAGGGGGGGGGRHVVTDPGKHADAAAEAAELAAWTFEHFRIERTPPVSLSMMPGATVTGGAHGGWVEGAVRGRAQNWARYMSDMPANKMSPVALAQEALDVLCPLGCKVTAHDLHWITANRMEAFLAVSRGSCEEPVFLEVEYRGAAGGPVVLLAAKGVTFDSGGLCLKKAESMVENRGSMAGAAAALGAIKALAELKVPINVTLVAPLCENMISGQCMKVGDVVRALNGLSIQIEDTDMEGRLMLADALVYGQAAHKPAIVIDVATLTNGILMATGGGCFGCFSNSESLWQCARLGGAVAGDRPWRFPLWDYYVKQVTDDPAVDLRNRGSGKATPCIGAAFLKKFICVPWLHMDTTGVGKLAHPPSPYLCPRRMTGRPARTLVHTLLHVAKDNSETRENKDC